MFKLSEVVKIKKSISNLTFDDMSIILIIAKNMQEVER